MSQTPSAAGSNGFAPALDFEKPLAKMEQEIQRLEAIQAESGRDYSDVIRNIRQQLETALKQAYENLTPWENVLVARHPKRPLLRDYIRMLCQDFCELHGDKLFGDDKAIVCGFARLAGHKVMLIGHHKGRETREKLETNFGCAHPEGYRKALRFAKLAAKFKVPVVCLVDTPGAYPGIGAEERGIAHAIAVNLMEFSRLPTPIIACVIGEGGSGGALGIAVADQVAVMQHAYYSVISPEGCAAILWKDRTAAPKAAEALRITAKDLLELKLVDEVIPEPLGGAHADLEATAAALKEALLRHLGELEKLPLDDLLRRRYEKYRRIGHFVEAPEPPAPEEPEEPEAAAAEEGSEPSQGKAANGRQAERGG